MIRRDVLSGVSFIGVVGDSVMFRLPRKRCLSVSTTRAIWTRDRGAKRLEVYKILKSMASPRRNHCATDKSYQPVWHSHLPKVKNEKFWHKCPIVLSIAVPNQEISRSKTSQVRSYIDNRRRSMFIMCPNKLRPMRRKSWSGPALLVLIIESLVMPKVMSEGL
jgi:hypothetical protein